VEDQGYRPLFDVLGLARFGSLKGGIGRKREWVYQLTRVESTTNQTHSGGEEEGTRTLDSKKRMGDGNKDVSRGKTMNKPKKGEAEGTKWRECRPRGGRITCCCGEETDHSERSDS